MADDKEARKIPLNEIEIISPNIDPSDLVQYSLQATRQGTGTVSELAKVVVNKALATDLDIHLARVKHGHTKILITLREYNTTIRIIEHCRQAGQINKDLADLTIKHLINSYKTDLESSEKFPGCLIFFGCFLSLGLIVLWMSRNVPGPEIPGSSKTPNVISQTTLQLPLPECGAGSNSSNQRWYPVWINRTDSETLEYVKKKYCSSAFVYNVTSSRQVIQVAGFQEQSKAQQLMKALESDPNSKVKSVEVGVPF